MARPDPASVAPDDLGHRTRYTDSSFHDFVCMCCGAGDGDGGLSKVCSNPLKPEDVAVVEVTITETTERRVLLKAQDYEAYRAAFETKAAHLKDNTPPALPKGTRVLFEAVMAGSITPVGAKA